MNKTAKITVAGIVTLVLLIATIGMSFAREFILGPETKGFNAKIDENANLTLMVRLQPRLDIGEVGIKTDGETEYASVSDIYFRRARFELSGHLTKDFKFGAEMEADKISKYDHQAAANFYHLYGDYKLSDNTGLMLGKKKLPYSRISLSSSSKQLLIERPNVTEDAKKLFGDKPGHGYNGPQIMFYGNASEGMLKYYLSLTDGWQAGQKTKWTEQTVENSEPAYVARVEISPAEWAEEKQSDAHLGKGRHLTFGTNYGAQRNIKYAATGTAVNPERENRLLFGADLSFHSGGLTLHGEYVSMRIEPSAGNDITPTGYYVQAGYFIKDVAVEPAIRYEYYDKDSNKRDNAQNTMTAGINWYLKGHSFKLSTNYAITNFNEKNSARLTDDDNMSGVQIQAQLYF